MQNSTFLCFFANFLKTEGMLGMFGNPAFAMPAFILSFIPDNILARKIQCRDDINTRLLDYKIL